MATWLEMGDHVHFCLSALGLHLTWTCVGLVHAASLWVHTCAVVLCLEDSVPLVSSVPSGSYALSVFSLADIPFRTECSKSLTLQIVQVWVSALFPIYWRKKLLWWQLSETLTYGYTKMSPRVILLPCSFSRTIVFGSPLGVWPLLSQVLGYFNSVRHVCFVEWVSNPTS